MRIVTRATILLAIGCALVDFGSAQFNRDCGSNKFQCNDGQCIASELLCDGKADCRDESDETVSECTKPEILCPDYAFRCRYGACVNGDAPCNGIKDCLDNSDETLPRCRPSANPSFSTTSLPPAFISGNCKKDQFRCDNGQCIYSFDVCDGTPNCADGSDEIFATCGSLNCPATVFRCAYGACIDGDLRCNGVENCADGSDEDPRVCGGQPWLIPRPNVTRPFPSGTAFCKAPPQPPNGNWKLECLDNNRGCSAAEGMDLQLGSHLVYSCNSGYKIRGSPDVTCSLGGTWRTIPVCGEIRCKILDSASTDANCHYNNMWISCALPVPPGTTASLKCRTSYQRDNVISRQGNNVRCNDNGQWEPDPIRCTPVCGVLPPPDLIPLIINGTRPNVTEFPWHASLYKETANGEKSYFCGASIIQDNLLLTAAHCVYIERTRKLVDASKIHVLTGNSFRDFNSHWHNPQFVKKRQVKNIYIVCSYLGLLGNYIWDIAILELTEPFKLTSWLVPVCLDPFTYGDKVVLESGSYGKVAGFGRTSTGPTSAVLQALSVPFVSYGECKNASRDSEIEKYITIDKFCAGYTNGSSVCDGDSGGGLVFKTEKLWYLRGIVSVSLGTIKRGGTAYCDHNLYSLYTQVSSHISWIQEIMARVEHKRPYQGCQDKS